MAHRQLSQQKLQEIRDLAAEWGKIVARRLSPQSGSLDFTSMEQVAAAAAGLTRGHVERPVGSASSNPRC